MFNYANLNDVEFENLCRDIMSAKLGVPLKKFARGRDGGIDLRNKKSGVVVQVKHYLNSSVENLLNALKKELPKVKRISPRAYYICCSTDLSPQRTDEIYELFKDYMDSDENIIALNDIDAFLKAPENFNILKKHYKLWLDSTNVLQDVFNRDISIDSGMFAADITDEAKMFVRTRAFDAALECLEHDRVLLLIGAPGVGKTITSKMLVLNYCAQGYDLRYTTDVSDLSGLKKALSDDPDKKEIIFLDDCFGQAYFNMKETQGNELIALINYVRMRPEKALLLNSRITIYNDAVNKTQGLIDIIDRNGCKVHVIDMTRITDVDKANILYNHLYFNGLGAEYFSAVKQDRNYYRIIDHKNYSPRIISYVCKPSVIKTVPPEKFFRFIMQNLDDPGEVWRDEYENRLRSPDRLLLNTLYSLTNTFIDIDMLKRCYCYRLSRTHDVDLSVDNFSLSLARLSESFVKIVDRDDKRLIGVVNPSVNDFLRAYINGDESVKNGVIDNACSVAQFKRLLGDKAFEDKIAALFYSREILDLVFESDSVKVGFVVYNAARLGILDVAYKPYVLQYLNNVMPVTVYGQPRIGEYSVFYYLLKDDFRKFYDVDAVLKDPAVLINILDRFALPELADFINLIDKSFVGGDRDAYIDVCVNEVNMAVEAHLSNVWASDFHIDVIGLALRNNTYHEDDASIDHDFLEQVVEDEIAERVVNEIDKAIEQLPEDIACLLNDYDRFDVDVSGVEDCVFDAFADTDFEPDIRRIYDDDDDGDDEVDIIFNR